ncbi:MAG: hypothetical protein F4010_07060 [Cenarchaeum sp. SB0669_bin_11]|nr:hypothetical protein [Cenarchaeum sp. SB0675_bin_21]MYL11883.1 hypothetical protein [Cenarchaeum sp. SB0669_bin_11]
MTDKKKGTLKNRIDALHFDAKRGVQNALHNPKHEYTNTDIIIAMSILNETLEEIKDTLSYIEANQQ